MHLPLLIAKKIGLEGLDPPISECRAFRDISHNKEDNLSPRAHSRMHLGQKMLSGRLLRVAMPAEVALRADFWDVDATKHISEKKKGFSVKRGGAVTE